MAFLSPDDEEDKDKSTGIGQSPMTTGAQPTMGGGRGGSTPMQPSSAAPQTQSSAMQPRGSGFLNLQSFLSPEIAKQNQDRVRNLGTQLQANERETFNKAAEPLKNATYTAGTLAMNSGGAPELVEKAVGGDQGAMGSLRALLEQDYTGPMSVNYDPNASGNMQKLATLGSADTTLNALSPGSFDANNLPQSQGNNWLDQALLKTDAGTMNEIGNVKTGAEALGKQTGADMTALAAKAQGLKDQAAKARESVRGGLQSYYDQNIAALDREVQQKIAADAQRQKVINEGYAMGDDGRAIQMGGGVMRGEVTGGGATRENVVTAENAKRFGLLSELLGAPSVQKTGDYKNVTAGYTADPNYQAPVPSRGAYDPKPLQVRTMLPGNVNDPNTPKGAFMAALNEAHKAADPSYTPGTNDFDSFMSGTEYKEFLDKFQREHPDIKLPTGEEADKAQGNAPAGWTEAAMAKNDPAKQKKFQDRQVAKNAAGTQAAVMEALRRLTGA